MCLLFSRECNLGTAEEARVFIASLLCCWLLHARWVILSVPCRARVRFVCIGMGLLPFK